MAMPKNIPQDELLDHPAVKVWLTLRQSRVMPERIVTLQRRHKSRVYRLDGIGPQNGHIIAKRSWTAKARAEYIIYEDILPILQIPMISYYGFIEEENGEYGWNFLEYIDGNEYSPRIEEYRALAARWLSLVHTSATGMAAAAVLPNRGPRYYLRCLESARARILNNLANPVLTVSDRTVLGTIIDQVDIVSSQWCDIEKLCDVVPQTLIHGDFASKNIRVRVGETQLALFPFDWGSAGWGCLAADLAQEGMRPNDYWASPRLDVYHSEVRAVWPKLALEELRMLASFGKIFRCLVCIDLDSESLLTPWVDKCMMNMRMYMNDMAVAIQTVQEIQ